MPFGLQPIHIVVIVLVALVIFGPKRLPAIGKWFARTFNDLRKGTRDMADSFKEESAKIDSPDRPREPLGTSMAAAPDARFCGSCGARQIADARFCSSCGTKLSAEGVAEKNAP